MSVSLRLVTPLLAVVFVATALAVPATPAQAAATRYEAENATRSQATLEAIHSPFSGTGYVNYDNVPGGYIQWMVNAPVAGAATIVLRFAQNAGVDRPMNIAVNGVVVSAGLSFPDTGQWNAWQTKAISAQVLAGANVIRATAVGATGGPNVDWLELSVDPDFQAEKATIFRGLVESNHAGYTGTGFVNMDFVVGSWIQWSVPAAVAGNVSISIRFAQDGGADRPMDVTVNGVLVRAGLSFPDTGAWTNWQTTTFTVALSAGTNLIRTTAITGAGGPNVDRLTTNAAGGGGGGGGAPTSITAISTGWSVPWGLSWLPGGTALVTERDTFRVFKVTLEGARTLVGTVPNTVLGGEGGLLGVAVDPNWATNRHVYFMHTAATNNRIARMTYDGASLSGYTAIVTSLPKSSIHNGGRIGFGPDGYLYAAAGDAANAGLAQDRNALNGKILRLKTDGTPAPGNPFGTLVYSYGHRNPQGLAWDSQGRLWASELGNNLYDELNLIKPGRNYGWPVCEGVCAVPGMENPKQQWAPSVASPSGIAIVRDVVYMAALRGRRLWRIPLLEAENTGTPTAYYTSQYGRLRAVSKVPGHDQLWLGTSNGDGNGGQPLGSDRIFRITIG